MKNPSVAFITCTIVMLILTNVIVQGQTTGTVAEFLAKGDEYYDKYDNESALNE